MDDGGTRLERGKNSVHGSAVRKTKTTTTNWVTGSRRCRPFASVSCIVYFFFFCFASVRFVGAGNCSRCIGQLTFFVGSVPRLWQTLIGRVDTGDPIRPTLVSFLFLFFFFSFFHSNDGLFFAIDVIAPSFPGFLPSFT